MLCLKSQSSIGLRSLGININASLVPIGVMRTYYARTQTFNKNNSWKLANPTTTTTSLIRHNITSNNFKLTRALYSTKTAPPPPPPQTHDKNEKGKKLLNKITRAFTFSISSILVLGAAGVALLVVYLILSELLLPSGDTRTFNKAVKLVEQNEAAQVLLDFPKGQRLKAHGMAASDRWVRNRPVHGVKKTGKDGKDHLVMQFQVESDKGRYGVVTLEQIDNSYWNTEFAYIALDVPGQRRLYIIEPKFQAKNYLPKLNGNGGFLGLKWGPKKDDEEKR
ncbi:Mitochondrial import inner membrane translocase subunit TIM21 [Spathaspora sp. JA1]|nr:Mitochondrial import inner membrane translocase subunit TIM21 [Spathaspora sp. JA1]